MIAQLRPRATGHFLKERRITMTTNFAKLHHDVCFGKAGGKVIWQPRIQCWYDDKMFEDGKLPGRYEGMSRVELYKDLGCSARVYEYNNCFYPVFDETIKRRTERDGAYTRHYIETPMARPSPLWTAWSPVSVRSPAALSVRITTSC